MSSTLDSILEEGSQPSISSPPRTPTSSKREENYNIKARQKRKYASSPSMLSPKSQLSSRTPVVSPYQSKHNTAIPPSPVSPKPTRWMLDNNSKNAITSCRYFFSFAYRFLFYLYIYIYIYFMS